MYALLHAARSTAAASLIGLSALGVAATAAAAPGPSVEPAPTNPAGLQTLLSHLSKGYTAGDCQPVTPSPNAVVEVQCGANHTQGGPSAANYMLYANAAAMNADFKTAIAQGTVQPFPDGKMGPGSWRSDATSNQMAGSDVIVAQPGGGVGMVWTDESKLILVAAALPDSATAYQWWLTAG